MQFSIYASLALLVATATAASSDSSAAASTTASAISSLASGVPTCAYSCIQTAITASGCNATDQVCLCTTGAKAFKAAGTSCLVQSDCTAGDLANIQEIVKDRCLSVLGASGSASASGTASATGVVAAVSGSASASASASASESAGASGSIKTGGAARMGAGVLAVGAGVAAFVL